MRYMILQPKRASRPTYTGSNPIKRRVVTIHCIQNTETGKVVAYHEDRALIERIAHFLNFNEEEGEQIVKAFFEAARYTHYERITQQSSAAFPPLAKKSGEPVFLPE